MAAKRLLVLAGLIVLALPLAARAGVTEDEETLKRDAVKRLTDSNDPALEVNIGRVYVKQAALKAARDLLEERGGSAGLTRERWNLEVPEWQAAERELMQGVDQLIAVKVADGKWVREAWAQLVSGRFKSEEADEIAVHFQTEGGDWQRRTIEWFVGELTLQTYTFTDRLKYGVPGSEAEMRDLQEVTYERMMTRGIHDFTKYPDTMRFATVGLGPEYFKMMAMQGVHVVHVHLEAVANEARASIRSRAALADPYIAQVRGRAGN